MLEDVVALATTLVKGIVAYPNDVQVRIEHEQDENGEIAILYYKVHQDDVGLILGAEGETSRSLRRVISLYGFRQTQKRVYLHIVTPRMRDQYARFK